MDATSQQHHDGASTNQRDSDVETPVDEHPALAHFIANFDPLARLEAEYAAVLAQSIASLTAEKAAPEDSRYSNNQQDGDSDDDDNEDDYARLPTSPGGGDGEYYQPLGDASDSDDGDGDDEELQADAALPAKAPITAVTPMDAATRETIMKSMQRMQLAPPPWATSAKLSDDELFAMVRDRLER